MTRSPTTAALVAALLLAGCASDATDPVPVGGADQASTSEATGGETGVTASRDEGADAPATGDAGPDPEGSATTDDAGTSDGTAPAPNTGADGGTTDGPTDGATEAPAEGPGVAAGTYRYDVEGSTSVGTFPPQPFRAVLTTTVSPSTAEGRQRIVTTTEFTEGSSPRSLDEERTLLHGADDIRLVRLVTDGNDDPIEFVVDPPAVFTVLRPAPGSTWEWTMTSTDGRTTAHTTVTARGTERVTVEGTAVEAQVADATVTFTGEDFEGTQELAIWFDPATRLILRQEASLEGRARVGGAWFDIAADDTRVLRRRQPA